MIKKEVVISPSDEDVPPVPTVIKMATMQKCMMFKQDAHKAKKFAEKKCNEGDKDYCDIKEFCEEIGNMEE